MSDTAGDEVLYAEIERHRRRRMLGVYIAAGFAVLMLVGVSYSLRMMHGSGWSTTSGRIVALGTGSGGEATMTSEFPDAAGTVHRDTQPASYHYGRGEPQVGESIEYIYKTSDLTGDFQAAPRADRILQWLFGVPAAIFVLMTVLSTWIVLRQRNFRRRLVRSGRREPGQQYVVRNRTVSLPAGSAGAQTVRMWRLEAKQFDPARAEFVDRHSDWQPTPPEPPTLGPDSPLQPIFIDPANPSRYWLPIGALSTWL